MPIYHHSWASRKLTPASAFYRTKKMPDCVSLVRYWTCSGIVSFFQSGTRLTGCRTVWHSGISIYVRGYWHRHGAWTRTCSMDMAMQHGHGYTARLWSCSMDLAMNVHGCRSADKQLSPASLVFRYFTMLSPASAFRHHGQSRTASHRLVR